MREENIKIREAAFIRSVAVAGEFFPLDLPEVAFAGRSNVGKSSLLNALLQRKKLAKVSKSPGRTRALNFFRVELVDHPPLAFVDLPGYGFAAVSKAERQRWGGLVESYLSSGRPIAAMVLLIDLRREPGEEERNLLLWLKELSLSALVAASKADKIAVTQRQGRCRLLARSLDLPLNQVIPVSARGGENIPFLWQRILQRVAIIDRKEEDHGPLDDGDRL